jgi:hypothetical protein
MYSSRRSLKVALVASSLVALSEAKKVTRFPLFFLPPFPVPEFDLPLMFISDTTSFTTDSIVLPMPPASSFPNGALRLNDRPLIPAPLLGIPHRRCSLSLLGVAVLGTLARENVDVNFPKPNANISPLKRAFTAREHRAAAGNPLRLPGIIATVYTKTPLPREMHAMPSSRSYIYFVSNFDGSRDASEQGLSQVISVEPQRLV